MNTKCNWKIRKRLKHYCCVTQNRCKVNPKNCYILLSLKSSMSVEDKVMLFGESWDYVSNTI
jgi:hypothetical protein